MSTPPTPLSNLVAIAETVTANLSKTSQLKTSADYVGCAGLVMSIKQNIAWVQAHRKSIRSADDPYKALESRLSAAEDRCKALMSEFVDRSLPEGIQAAQTALVAGDREALLASLTPVPSIPGVRLSNHVEAVVEDPDKIPAEYWIVQAPTLDHKKLLSDVRAGLTVPGVRRVDSTSVAVSVPTAPKPTAPKG